jgi:peptide chain release factor 2
MGFPDSQCDAAHKLVKDVRTGYETSNVDGVMNGEIDEF